MLCVTLTDDPMTIDKATLLDKILLKFRGNITVKWSDLQTGLWDDIATYHVCENNINFLVGDGMLKRDTVLHLLSMTDKGFATMTDLDNLGYVTKAKKERNETMIKYIGFCIGVATFILLFFRTFTPHLFEDKIKTLQTIESEQAISPQGQNEIKGLRVSNNTTKQDTAQVHQKTKDKANSEPK